MSPQYPINLLRLSEFASAVMDLAHHNATELRHNYIGTEHVLLGITEIRECVAADIILEAGLNLSELSERVKACLVQGAVENSDKPISFTPRMKKVIALAQAESAKAGVDFICTDHMFIGLISERQGIAGRVLIESGMTLENVRAAIWLRRSASMHRSDQD